MNYWLIKSEPNTWSWDDHVKKGVEHWDGVRNYQANNNMKAMKIGDLAFFEVVSGHYPDHTDTTGKGFGMVDFKAVKPVKSKVSLAEIKAHPALQNMALVKQSRLSVAPVSKDEWKVICGMAGV